MFDGGVESTWLTALFPAIPCGSGWGKWLKQECPQKLDTARSPSRLTAKDDEDIISREKRGKGDEREDTFHRFHRVELRCPPSLRENGGLSFTGS